MTSNDDITVQILRDIRDEIRDTRTSLSERLDRTNERLDRTNERLDHTIERLDRVEQRQVASETRLATELVAVADAVRTLHAAIVEDRDLRGTVADLELRVTRLEQRA